MIISEWTLLILLMVPLAAFIVGALLITAWSQTMHLLRTCLLYTSDAADE